MASLHKRPRSKYWHAAFTDADGKRVLRSTKTSDRALAKSIAFEWAKAARAASAGRIVEAQSRRVISDIYEQATGSPLHFHTCADWFAEWLKGKQGTAAKPTLQKYKQVSRDFLKHLGDRAALPLPAIGPRDIREFRDLLRSQGRAPSSVNHIVRKVLSVPFLAAQRAGYISLSPCASVEALRDDGHHQRDHFTSEQILSLYQAAEGDWQGVILAGYYTGLRLGDIVEIRWESVDLEGKTLVLRVAKTGKPITVPLADDLAAWITDQPRGIGQAPLFPSLVGKAGAGKSALSKQFKKIMARAKIQGRALRTRKADSAGRNTESLSFHSLRHSFNTALASAGIAQETRMKLTGHSTAAVNAIYTHTELATLRNAVSQLPAIVGK